MPNLAIFASGAGSNAHNIIQYFKGHESIHIGLIVSSHKDAGVLKIAATSNVPSLVLDKKEYYGSGDRLIKQLARNKIDGIILAGFIWLVPNYLIEQYSGKIINIHPALLPKYGGKGMYGMHVHESVWKNKEAKTGITIHEVNARYDEGKIIFQDSCPVTSQDTPLDIAHKVHALEYAHFPKVIEDYFGS